MELIFVHSNFQGVFFSSGGVSLTPYSGVIFGGSYFNFKKEFKELFFRGKNHPRYWGVKLIPKEELSCT